MSLMLVFGRPYALDKLCVRVAGEGKADIALEDILNRHGLDNKVPCSSDEEHN